MAEVWGMLSEGCILEKDSIDHITYVIGPAPERHIVEGPDNVTDALIDLLIWVRKEKEK